MLYARESPPKSYRNFPNDLTWPPPQFTSKSLRLSRVLLQLSVFTTLGSLRGAFKTCCLPLLRDSDAEMSMDAMRQPSTGRLGQFVWSVMFQRRRIDVEHSDIRNTADIHARLRGPDSGPHKKSTCNADCFFSRAVIGSVVHSLFRTNDRDSRGVQKLRVQNFGHIISVHINRGQKCPQTPSGPQEVKRPRAKQRCSLTSFTC